jgi:hypothetical protein
VHLGRPQSLASEHAFEGRAPDEGARSPRPAGGGTEYPVARGVEARWQGGAQHGGQGDGGNLRDPRTQFDEIRHQREAIRDVPQLLPRAVVVVLLRPDHHAEPEMTGERRDDRGSEADLRTQMLRDPVTQRREGVRRDHEAH